MKGAAHDCSRLVTGGCWGRARSYHFEANPTECIKGDSSLPSYDTVALVSSKKNLPYYHVSQEYCPQNTLPASQDSETLDGGQFFMEVLPRVASILPLLHSHPDIGVALDTKLLFRSAESNRREKMANFPRRVCAGIRYPP